MAYFLIEGSSRGVSGVTEAAAALANVSSFVGRPQRPFFGRGTCWVAFEERLRRLIGDGVLVGCIETPGFLLGVYLTRLVSDLIALENGRYRISSSSDRSSSSRAAFSSSLCSFDSVSQYLPYSDSSSMNLAPLTAGV